MLKQIKTLFKKSSFIKNVAVLSTGSALSHLLLFISAPIISRLYSPEHFGEFMIFLSLINIIGNSATLKYELAILLPEKKEEANYLLFLSLFCLASIVIFCLLIVAIARLFIAEKLRISNPAYLWLLPIGIFLVGANEIFTMYNNRIKKYKIIAGAQISNSSTKLLSQIFLGLKNLQNCGLYFAHILGLFTNCLVMTKSITTNTIASLKQPNWHQMLLLGKKFKEFPMFFAPAMLVNQIAGHTHVFLFQAFFGDYVLGLIMICWKTLSIPASVISNSISQVFFQNISQTNSRKILLDKYKKLILGISLLATPVIFIAILLPQNTTAILLGEKWREAILYMKPLTISFSVFFVAYATTHIYTKLRLQKFRFYSNMINVFMIVTVITVGGTITDSYNTLILFATYDICYNIFLIFMGFRFIKTSTLLQN